MLYMGYTTTIPISFLQEQKGHLLLGLWYCLYAFHTWCQTEMRACLILTHYFPMLMLQTPFGVVRFDTRVKMLGVKKM